MNVLALRPNLRRLTELYIGVDRHVAQTRPPVTNADAATSADFEHWVSPHWTAMTHFAVRLVGPSDGEDVVQDALAVAWRKRAQFDTARGSARSWLLALVFDQARKTQRRAMRRIRFVAQREASVSAPVELAVDLERAVRQLSDRQKLAVDLFYYLDLPIVEVATVMGCTEGTAKSTLSDARTRLHQLLGDGFA
jgi:RNA polymerase sigma factor (sigma-70 family)